MIITNACPHCQAEVEFSHEEVGNETTCPVCSGAFTTINPHRGTSKAIPPSFRPLDASKQQKLQPAVCCPFCKSTDTKGPIRRQTALGYIFLAVALIIGLTLSLSLGFIILIVAAFCNEVVYKCKTCGKVI